MALLLQNEVKRIAAESRLHLLQSERHVRSTIHDIRVKLEDWLRTAESTLLKDLQDNVQSQEQKIKDLENSARMSGPNDDCKSKKSLLQLRLSFIPAIVSIRINEQLDHLLEQCCPLGTVKLVPADAQSDTDMYSTVPLSSCPVFNIRSSENTQSNGYVVGRIAASPVLSGLLREKWSNSRPDTYEDPSSTKRQNSHRSSSTTSTEFDFSGTIRTTMDRRRKNSMRREASLLLRGTLENIKEEHFESMEDKKTEPSCQYSSKKSSETCDYANCETLKQENILAKYQGLNGLNKQCNGKTDQNYPGNDTDHCDILKDKDPTNEIPSSPKSCLERNIRIANESTWRTQSQEDNGSIGSGRSDSYSDVFVSLPYDMFNKS